MNYDKNKEIIVNLFQRMRALSSTFEPVLKNAEMKHFFKEQLELRKEITEIFFNSCGKICRQCQGNCCNSYIWLFKKDLLLFLSQNKFSLPEPDWNFINSKKCCIFLSDSGCILKEFRPWQCLKHVCNKFYAIKIDAEVLKEITVLVDKYAIKTNQLAGEIQQKWHLTLD
ncbi:MAG: hypothetical protein US76_02270 [Parcubacteria group bacterium GW2011_GWA2_38_13b]|nr:MAG: hypothetical protein US76_02270 [Parcubacteria group bacterium GW2011_GWA2_38_13b]